MERLVCLNSIKVLKVDIVNHDLPEGTELTVNINTTVHRLENNMCLCVCSIIVSSLDEENPSQAYHVRLDVQGSLNILSPSIKSEDLHLLAASEVYPHVRAITSSVIGACGLAAFSIPASILQN